MNGLWSWGGWSMLSRLCFSSFLEPTWSVCLRGRQRQWCCWGCYWWGGKEFVEETIVKELQINQDLHCWKRAVRKQHLSWRGQFPYLKHQTPKTKNLSFTKVCRNLADGNHSSKQKEVQATVQKFNAAELILKTTPLIFVIIFLGSWFVHVSQCPEIILVPGATRGEGKVFWFSASREGFSPLWRSF